MACFKASTLDVCPVPELKSCKFFAKTIVFDLVCLHILEAKTKSFSSEFIGFFDVQYSKLFSLSVKLSLSCFNMPFKHVRN